MSDTLGDFWRDVKPALKAQALERRETRMDNNDDILALWERDYGVTIKRHTDYHFTLAKGGVTVDFWPSKTKWSVRGRPTHGNSYGLKKLAQELGITSK